VFAAKAFNPAGADGLLRGGGGVMLTQIIGVVAAAVFAVVVSFVILYVIDKTIGLRVTPDEEREGLDTALHGESGYEMGSTGAGEAHYEAVEPEPVVKLVTSAVR
jgi:ammonium transporter, Amt family